MRLSDLDPERAGAELAAWATAFARGQIRHPLLAPALESGERWAARISPAGKHALSQGDVREPTVITGGGSGDDHFQAAVTSTRVLLCAGKRVVQAWPISELHDIRALDNLTGAALLPYEPNPDYDDRFDTLMSALAPSGGGLAQLVPHQLHRAVHLDWLKFEAACAAHQDRLGAWTAALPRRLATIAATARQGV
ncbi:MAG TPA: hypothetical protein VGD68_01955 [Streptosporangiaceae bacterium]